MSDILSAISVFLVFIGFILSNINKTIEIILKKEKPTGAQKTALEKYRKEICNFLKFQLVPIQIVFAVTFYLLLPHTIKIITDSRLSVWNFDILNSLFICIEGGILLLACYIGFKIKEIMSLLKSK